MSMDRCYKCGNFVDTDDDVDCYVEVKYGQDRCYCEPCREALDAEREAMERKASICEQQAEAAHEAA